MSTPTTRPTPMRRMLRENTTQQAFALAGTDILVARSSLDAAYITLGGFRGVTALGFVGTGSADQATTIRVYTVQDVEDLMGDNRNAPMVMVRRAVDLTVTLGTMAGAEGGAVLDTELVADTIVSAAATAHWTALLGMFGGSEVLFSPADNTMASIAWTDLANISGLYFDFALAGGPTSLNLILARGT